MTDSLLVLGFRCRALIGLRGGGGGCVRALSAACLLWLVLGCGSGLSASGWARLGVAFRSASSRPVDGLRLQRGRGLIPSQMM